MMDSGRHPAHRTKFYFAVAGQGVDHTPCAAQVPEELLPRNFVEVVNRYPGVTHNYLRRHHFNVWFTLIAESVERLDQILAEISAVSGVQVLSLRSREGLEDQVDLPVETGTADERR